MSAPVQPRRGGQNTTPSDLIGRRRRAAPGRGEQCRPTRSDTAALSPDPERQHPSGWNTTRADSVARQRIRTPPSSVHLRVDNALRVPSVETADESTLFSMES